VTSRGLEDGGEQNGRWSIGIEPTLNDLGSVASDRRDPPQDVKSYESEARRNDESAERVRRGLDR
jgi:hypothetical protein